MSDKATVPEIAISLSSMEIVEEFGDGSVMALIVRIKQNGRTQRRITLVRDEADAFSHFLSVGQIDNACKVLKRAKKSLLS